MANPRTAIVGVGYTPVMRHSRDSVGTLAVEAALHAIGDAGLKPGDIDGYVGCPRQTHAPDGVEEVSAGYMIEELGIEDPGWVTDVDGLPTDALLVASQALQVGACRYALVLGTAFSGSRIGHAHDHRYAVGSDQFTRPYGFGMTGDAHSLRLQRYMHDYRATREELFGVIEGQREYARLNQYAYWRDRELVLDEYLYSRWIYEPLCLFDCVIPVTAAGALVLTTADRAKDLPNPPAYIAGYANSRQPEDTIFQVSGIYRQDVHVAQLFDGFSPFVWYWLEGLGFCGPGEGHAFTQEGRTRRGGELPVNTHGGDLGEGPLRGLGHLREAAVQVMGRGGDRQAPNAGHCLVSVGQFTPGMIRYLVMLSKD